jgi:hypothetical protein
MKHVAILFLFFALALAGCDREKGPKPKTAEADKVSRHYVIKDGDQGHPS